MNKKLGLLLIIIAIAGATYLAKDKTEQVSEIGEKTQAEAASTSNPQAETQSPVSVDSNTATTPAVNQVQASASSNEPVEEGEVPEYLREYESIPDQHKLSLVETTQRIFRFAKRDVKSQDLVNEFEQKALAPELRVDSNPYTGTLNVVRTRKVMPGTRYFHAQFFENEDGSEYVQHVSFEFKASEHSFAAVEKTILQQFSEGNVEPTQNKENFKSWRRDDGYIIWMKKLDATDIKDNPFNVYTPEDIGTIRVAIELDIHDHSPAFHAEQGPLEEEE